MDINTVTEHTAVYLRPIKTLTRVSILTWVEVDGKPVRKTSERRQVYAALYVAPLTPNDEEPAFDPSSRFQVRSLVVYDDGEREELRVTDFTDRELAQIYCEHAASIRETRHQRI